MKYYTAQRCPTLILWVTMWFLFTVKESQPLVWTLKQMEDVVLSHSETLEEIHNYLRKTDYFWNWFTRNENRLTDVLSNSDNGQVVRNPIYEAEMEKLKTKMAEMEEKSDNIDLRLSSLERFRSDEMSSKVTEKLDILEKKFENAHNNMNKEIEDIKISIGKKIGDIEFKKTNFEDVQERINKLQRKFDSTFGMVRTDRNPRSGRDEVFFNTGLTSTGTNSSSLKNATLINGSITEDAKLFVEVPHENLLSLPENDSLVPFLGKMNDLASPMPTEDINIFDPTSIPLTVTTLVAKENSQAEDNDNSSIDVGISTSKYHNEVSGLGIFSITGKNDTHSSGWGPSVSANPVRLYSAIPYSITNRSTMSLTSSISGDAKPLIPKSKEEKEDSRHLPPRMIGTL